ncbi:MAG: hypothetical protein HYZ65_01605 [Burkholderiales bacterium]|nr:hypothetical protein [Burkholderiales bacterium]
MSKNNTSAVKFFRVFSDSWSRLVLALLIAACWPARATTILQTFPVKLSRDEQLLLEHIVCGQEYGVAVAEIDARAFSANASQANYADVRCRPHAQLKGKPLYYVAQCAREQKLWSCSPARLETLVTLKDRELVVRPGTVPPAVAVETIQKISTYGYFQAHSLDAALQSTCVMGMGDAPDLIEISCRRWSVTVSFWCPQKKTGAACPRVIYMTEHS